MIPREAPILMVDVVLPTPPLRLQTEIMVAIILNGCLARYQIPLRTGLFDEDRISQAILDYLENRRVISVVHDYADREFDTYRAVL